MNKKIEKTLADQFKSYNEEEITLKQVAENDVPYYNLKDIDSAIKEKRKEMEKAAKNLDFMAAAQLRDQIKDLTEKKANM